MAEEPGQIPPTLFIKSRNRVRESRGSHLGQLATTQEGCESAKYRHLVTEGGEMSKFGAEVIVSTNLGVWVQVP